MKLSREQESALAEFDEKYAHYEDMRRSLEVRLREQLEEQLTHLRVDASLAGNRATALGVPVSRLGDPTRPGLRTRNWRTIREFLDITATAPLATTAPSNHLARNDDGTITLRAYRAELVEAIAELGWTEADLDARPDLREAVFEVSADGRVLAVTPDWLEDDNDRHPVVALVSVSMDIQREIREYASY